MMEDLEIKKKKPSGWLLVLIFILCVFLPTKSAQTVQKIQMGKEASWLMESPHFQSYISFSWAMTLILSALLLYTGYQLYKVYKPSSVKLAIASLWVSGPIYVIVCNVIGSSVLKTDVVWDDTMMLAGISCFWPIVWTIYLKRSKQVKTLYMA